MPFKKISNVAVWKDIRVWCSKEAGAVGNERNDGGTDEKVKYEEFHTRTHLDILIWLINMASAFRSHIRPRNMTPLTGTLTFFLNLCVLM